MYIQRYKFKTTYFAYKCCASISPSLVIWQSKKKSRAATLAQKHQHLICHGERTSRASSIKLNTFRFYLRWLHVWICFSVYSHFLWWPFWPFWKKKTHTHGFFFGRLHLFCWLSFRSHMCFYTCIAALPTFQDINW